MSGILPSLDVSYLEPHVTMPELLARQGYVAAAHAVLEGGTGAGNKFLGWLDPEAMLPEAQLGAINDAVAFLRREQVDVMVVVGIGGSYLGARTVIEALRTPGGPDVWYAGHTLSPDYMAQLLADLKGKRFCINVVSKSGTTTEPAIAFRLLRKLLVDQVGEARANQLIIATTDPTDGALRQMTTTAGYVNFPIPPNVGGRFSVFTAVGLLPIAFAGIDIAALRQGAIACAKACANPDLAKNPAYLYAAARNVLYHQGKDIELLATFEPRLHFLAEWWKQLYGESEGKRGMSIFPASVEFTTDLHSMGQWIQDGRRAIFETFVDVTGGLPAVSIPAEADANKPSPDELDYLEGVALETVNRRAFEGTALAHWQGGVPNMTLRLPGITPASLGALLYFFEKACGISGYLLGVNPFDQPGVNGYKDNMFALLNKPGYQDQHATVSEEVAKRQGKQVVSFER